jgi:hypothetical protein
VSSENRVSLRPTWARCAPDVAIGVGPGGSAMSGARIDMRGIACDRPAEAIALCDKSAGEAVPDCHHEADAVKRQASNTARSGSPGSSRAGPESETVSGQARDQARPKTLTFVSHIRLPITSKRRQGDSRIAAVRV